MAKNIPLTTIKFKQIPIELETEMFYDFLKGDWGKMITDKYPAFLKIIKIKTKKKKLVAIKNEILKIRTELGNKLVSNLEKIEGSWRKVEKAYLEELPKIIQTDWPKKEIIAYVSLNPICPRYLSSWSFVVTHDRSNSNTIIAHELSHFLFFKKLKSVFPKTSKEKYEAPHTEWLLSEFVAVVISHDARILKIIGVKDDYYPEHKKLKINNETITKTIEDLYTKLVIDKDDFSEFIKECLKILK